MQRALVLGGTVFVGRAIVEELRAQGVQVTVLHRGKSGTGLWPDVEERLGDRDGGLSVLGDDRWDVCIDTCGYVPRIVRQSAEYLKDRVSRYLFISTISVYSGQNAIDFMEGGPVHAVPPAEVEEVTGETYGGLKVGCENVVQEIYGNRSTILRPGLLFGPHDPTDRFTYWLWAIARFPVVVAPMPKFQNLQILDARDLAKLTVVAATRGVPGIFNAAGQAVAWNDLIGHCCRAVEMPAQILWADEDSLRRAGVEPWTDLPVWVPASDPSQLISRVNYDRARGLGFKPREMRETVTDLAKWLKDHPKEDLKAGLREPRLQEVIRALGGV